MLHGYGFQVQVQAQDTRFFKNLGYRYVNKYLKNMYI